jgi:hypothetical protein
LAVSVKRRGLRLPSHLADLMQPGMVRAGVLSGATYPAANLTNAATGETRPDPRAGMPVAVIAAALEYGDGQNHARPFMATTAAKEGDTWAHAFVTLLKQGTGAKQALMTVGQVMKEDVQATVLEWPADNSESWAEFKGFSHGLILTGHLSRSIESEVAMSEGG